jgi:hypothetical protein
MTNEISSNDQDTFDRLKNLRAEAIKHTKLLRRMTIKRRQITVGLIETGYSRVETGYTRANIARKLVTRQAIQKMLSF